MFLELMIRKPQASAQFLDLPAQDEAKSGSLIDATTSNGVGAMGFGWKYLGSLRLAPFLSFWSGTYGVSVWMKPIKMFLVLAS
jgi:hypothetical protein